MIEAKDAISQRRKAIQREAQHWVVRLASQQATSDDARDFKRWCATSAEHASAFVEVRAVWQDLRPAAQRIESAERATLARRPTDAQRPPMRPGRRAFLGAALAASAGYLVVRPPLGLWPAAAELTADYRTGTGEQREWVTAEGVVVQMNTRTRVDRRRSLVGQGGAESMAALELLEGEAEISTDGDAVARAVQLTAGNSTIAAQRARFNVRFIQGEVCVTCLAGRVEIRRGGLHTSMGAGQQLIYTHAGPGVSRIANPDTVSAWRRRQLVFDQTPLASVVDEVNRYRPGKLILTNSELGLKRVHASFSIDRLDDMITLMRDVYRLNVTRLPGGIVLLGSASA